MTRFLLFFISLLFFAPTVFAQGKDHDVTVDLASDHVDITTGFNGTTMQMFGVRHGAGDLAIIVRGPARTMSVRRKEKVFGAWVNTTFETFKRVPSYYNYATSVPLDKLATPEVLRQYGIGPENLQFNKPDSADETRIIFREALIRNKQKQGLYVTEPVNIGFMGADFFRADFYVPANVPVGDYEIQTLSFVDGQLRDIKTRIVRVAQVGTSARIHEFAHANSLIYGLLCVMLAIFAGWFSNRVRRG